MLQTLFAIVASLIKYSCLVSSCYNTHSFVHFSFYNSIVIVYTSALDGTVLSLWFSSVVTDDSYLLFDILSRIF